MANIITKVYSIQVEFEQKFSQPEPGAEYGPQPFLTPKRVRTISGAWVKITSEIADLLGLSLEGSVAA